MKAALLIILSVVAQSTVAGVYKWTDAAGRVHYSDRPVSGAEIQEVALPARGDAEPGDGDEDVEPLVYDELEIVSPEENQTVRNDTGTLDLGIVVRPPLQDDHSVRILVDGAPISGAVDGTQFSVNGVPYGSHRIQVEIVDAEDQQVAASAVVNFHLRKLLPPVLTVD